ncbi:MAG: AI-2E family transporter [Chloroflexi bacterium]|nr:AI-2E family transporter [Chloroflexota bacterium]
MNTRWSAITKWMVLVFGVVVSIWLLFSFSQAIAPTLIAVILAYLLNPPTNWLCRRVGWPRGLAVIVIIIIAVLLLALAPVIITPSLVAIISNIDLDITSFLPFLQNVAGQSLHLGPITLSFADLIQQFQQEFQAMLAPLATGALQFASGLAISLYWAVYIVVLMFWLLKDSYRLEGWMFGHIPPTYRNEVGQLLHEMGSIWGSFFRGEIVLGVAVGALVGVSMWILGLPNVLLLALISGLMEFVPTIGPVLAAMVGVLVALVFGSSWLPLNPLIMAVVVAIVYIIVFQFEQIYLLPRIVGRRVRLHPAVVFAGTIIGASQIGLMGVLIAAPVMASVRLFGGYVYRKLLDMEPFAEKDESDTVGLAWRGTIRGQPVAAVLFDLDGTLIDTDDAMLQRWARRLGPLQRLFPHRDAIPFLRHWLMLAEGPINWLLTQFDRLSLDDEALRLNRWLQTMLGLKSPTDMVLIPGVAEMLTTLRQDYRLALVTSRGRASTEHFLQSTGLDGMFELVITADDVRRLKPHPEPVLTAAAGLGLAPEQCVMVGDTTVDIYAARAAGARTAGVLCGFGSRRDLESADLVLESTADLTQWL